MNNIGKKQLNPGHKNLATDMEFFYHNFDVDCITGKAVRRINGYKLTLNLPSCKNNPTAVKQYLDNLNEKAIDGVVSSVLASGVLMPKGDIKLIIALSGNENKVFKSSTSIKANDVSKKPIKYYREKLQTLINQEKLIVSKGGNEPVSQVSARIAKIKKLLLLMEDIESQAVNLINPQIESHANSPGLTKLLNDPISNDEAALPFSKKAFRLLSAIGTKVKEILGIPSEQEKIRLETEKIMNAEVQMIGAVGISKNAWKGELGKEIWAGRYELETLTIRYQEPKNPGQEHENPKRELHIYADTLKGAYAEWIAKIDKHEITDLKEKRFDGYVESKMAKDESFRNMLLEKNVIYFNKDELSKVKINFNGKGGKIRQIGLGSDNNYLKPLKAGNYAFVVGSGASGDDDLALYLAPKGKTEDGLGKIQHASFFRSGKVASAGMMYVNSEGKIEIITQYSGHYLPTHVEMRVILNLLQEKLSESAFKSIKLSSNRYGDSMLKATMVVNTIAMKHFGIKLDIGIDELPAYEWLEQYNKKMTQGLLDPLKKVVQGNQMSPGEIESFNIHADELKNDLHRNKVVAAIVNRLTPDEIVQIASFPFREMRGLDREMLIDIYSALHLQFDNNSELSSKKRLISQFKTNLKRLKQAKIAKSTSNAYLSSGAVNSVYRVSYIEKGQKIEAIFKPETAESSLKIFFRRVLCGGTAAAANIPIGVKAHFDDRSVAVSVVDAFMYGKEGRISVKTEHAIIDGQRGIVMEEAPGGKPKTIGLYDASIDLSQLPELNDYVKAKLNKKKELEPRDLNFIALMARCRDVKATKAHNAVTNLYEWSFTGTFARYERFVPNNANTAEGLLKVQLLDYITGQIDRHPGNYYIDALGNVKAIDNDCSFGTDSVPKGVDVRNQAAQMGFIPNNGSLMLRMPNVVTIKLKEQIDDLYDNPIMLRKILTPYITAQEIDATISRLNQLHAHMNSTKVLKVLGKEGLFSAAAIERMDPNNSYWAREIFKYNSDESNHNHLRSHLTLPEYAAIP